MRNLPPPSWLRTFEAAARLGGFTAASEELGLTPAAVSQQIRMLEARLGHPLFHRRARGVELTALGQSYLPAVRRGFDDMASATAGLFGIAQGRPLVVRGPPSFSALRLTPALHRFHGAHPQIALRLCSAIWAESSPQEDVDVDIRYGDGRWPEEEIRRVSEPGSVLVCPPDTSFGPGFAASAQVELLRGAIHIMGCESFWDRYAGQYGLAPGEIGRAICVDTTLAALELVANGAGVALVAPDLAQPFAREGRVRIAPGIRLDHAQAHYVLLPRQDAPRTEAQLFREWLVAEMAPSEIDPSEPDREPRPDRAVDFG